MAVSIILTYKRSAKIYKYIKHSIKKCHTRNTMLCYVCDMLCYMCNTTNIITECNLVTNISRGHHHTGNSSVTHVTFVQFFYFHWATIKHLDGLDLTNSKPMMT